MLVNVDKVDLDAIRREYKDMKKFFNDLINSAIGEEAYCAINEFHKDALVNFITNAFDVNADEFLQEAYDELCPPMGYEEGERMFSPLEILHLKISDILGTENPHIIEIYARRSTKH